MKKPIAIGLSMAALAAVPLGIALWMSDEPAGGGVLATAPPPVASPAPEVARAVIPPRNGTSMMYELHGTSPRGAPPSALLAPHGDTPRSYTVGQTVGPGVTLETVARGHVILREGTQMARIDLPSRLGGSGEPVAPAERGLKPEPQPPSGELSGAQMAAIQAQQGIQASPTAEEIGGTAQ